MIKNSPLILALIICSLLTSCNKDEQLRPEVSCEASLLYPGPCEFSSVTSCSGFSFSIVDAQTYENLVGTEGQLIHPDSIVITNTRQDTMPSYFTRRYSDGWWEIAELNPFDEITCGNQCLLDSAFTRTYYLYLGSGDTDTIDVTFPARTQGPIPYFNGSCGRVPDDRPPETGLGNSSFWFRKEL